MESKIIRVAQGKESTLSQLYINGIFQCYLLEDKIREVKIPSQMIEISGLPNFSFVYIHTGNTIKDTAGCPLCGFGFGFIDGNYQVSQSVAAYKMIYPKLVALAKVETNTMIIENNFQF